jgi:sigma-B regulation protein RsbU (phosphoserine phosphatase)
MGEDLLSLSSVHDQVLYIERELSRLVGGDQPVMACLIDEFKPLPHKGSDSSETVEFVTPSQCEDMISASLEPDPYVLTVPLKTPDGLIGYLRLDQAQDSPLSEEHKEFLATAGSYFAKIFDATRLHKLKEWRKEQLTLMRSVNSEIVQLRDQQELFQKITQLIQTTFKFYFVALYTADGTIGRITYRSSAGKALSKEQIRELAVPGGIAFGAGLVGACAQSGQEIYTPDLSQENRYVLVNGLEEARSKLCLPLMIGERVLGVLEIMSDLPRRLHENDILVLRILADNVAVAIRNLDLIDDLLDQTWLSTMLLQVSEASQQHDNADDLAAAVARLIPLFTNVEHCAIFLRDITSGEFILNSHYGFEKEEEPSLAMLPYSMEGLELFTQLLAERQPVPFNRDMLKCGQENKDHPSSRCGLVPMAVHGKVFGVILVDDLGKEDANDASKISISEALMAVGRQTALTVENLRLKESQENEAYVTAVLLQVAEMVATSADLQETMDSIINFLPLVVGVDTAFVYLYDEASSRLHLGSKLSYHWKNQLTRLPTSTRYFAKTNMGVMLNSDTPFFFQVTGQPMDTWIKAEVKTSLDGSARASISEPLLIVMPLFTHEGRYGLLFILESEKGFEYREKKVEIISGIARNLSMSMQNEKLKNEMINRERISQEFQLAQEIQKTFLPEALPVIAGWELNARWRPALQVGGDFYDAFMLDEDRVGLVIADVSDKGMPAALYMTVARTLIHAEALEGDQPSAALMRVNRSLLLNSQKGLFVTCLYAILNTRSGEMTYANAGHNRPLWLRRSRKDVVWLEMGGMPLGVSEQLKLSDQQLQMKEHDQMVFYTDGVTEARAVDETLFGEERLFNVLNLFRNRPSSSLIDSIDQKIMDFRGGAPVSDDLTLMVIHRYG